MSNTITYNMNNLAGWEVAPSGIYHRNDYSIQLVCEGEDGRLWRLVKKLRRNNRKNGVIVGSKIVNHYDCLEEAARIGNNLIEP